MEPVRYLRALRRSWWIVLLAVVVAVAVGAVVFWRTTPVYATGVQVLATTGGQSTGDDPTGTGVGSMTYIAGQAQAYAQLASTPPAVADAASAAGYAGATPVVTASANGTDPFVVIVVSDEDPDVARAVANAYPTTLPATSTRLSGSLPVPVTLAVLTPASLPTSPVSPVLSRYLLLALAIGLVGGVGIALGRGYLDRTLRDSDEVEAALDLPVLATVPAELSRERVPALTHPRSARAEAYRQIRTTLATLAPGAAPHAAATVAPEGGRSGDPDGPDGGPEVVPRSLVLLVTSAASGEGKTSTAVNLAVTMRQAGQRVALVDADLRRPQVAASLGLDAPLGLAHVLAGSAGLAEAAHVDDEGIGRLTVLGAGSIPDNPSEALGSAAMLQVLADLAAEHDVVVVDSPPVIPVTDALVLAPHVDAVVLVVRLGLVRRDRIRRARTVVERVRGHLIGVVANGADTSRDRYYRYYRYERETPSLAANLRAALARRDAAPGSATGPAAAPGSGPTSRLRRPEPTGPPVSHPGGAQGVRKGAEAGPRPAPAKRTSPSKPSAAHPPATGGRTTAGGARAAASGGRTPAAGGRAGRPAAPAAGSPATPVAAGPSGKPANRRTRTR